MVYDEDDIMDGEMEVEDEGPVMIEDDDYLAKLLESGGEEDIQENEETGSYCPS